MKFRPITVEILYIEVEIFVFLNQSLVVKTASRNMFLAF